MVLIQEGSFFLFNKEYDHGRIGVASSNKDVVGYEQAYYPDQLWYMEESKKVENTYYLQNCHFDNWRLFCQGPGTDTVGVYEREYYDDQLWTFKQEGEYYRIYSYSHPSCKLAYSRQNTSLITAYDGGDYDDQLWKIVPRFKVVDIKRNMLWQADNRQGSAPFSENVEITTGIKLTKSSSMSTKTQLTVSMKSSISAAIEGIGGASLEITQELTTSMEKSLSSSEEKSWLTKRTINFSAPAGKNYRVKQSSCMFESFLSSDDCMLTGNYIIEETDGEFTD